MNEESKIAENEVTEEKPCLSTLLLSLCGSIIEVAIAWHVGVMTNVVLGILSLIGIAYVETLVLYKVDEEIRNNVFDFKKLQKAFHKHLPTTTLIKLGILVVVRYLYVFG